MRIPASHLNSDATFHLNIAKTSYADTLSLFAAYLVNSNLSWFDGLVTE
jgi:hypothetical protein